VGFADIFIQFRNGINSIFIIAVLVDPFHCVLERFVGIRSFQIIFVASAGIEANK
jgi:hypothetical protein